MKRYVLADCNNFFVSCERIFAPHLLEKPVVVLSSNDGCVIARSNEAKALDIPMGAPFFKFEHFFQQHNVQVLSSNFALYSDISSRIMYILHEYATDVEVYSIDEAFVFFPPQPTEFAQISEEKNYYELYAQFVRKRIKQKTGIPLSFGIGPTKTLAKIANSLAKKDSNLHGVCDLTDHPQLDAILQTITVGDIWGIGHRYSAMLEQQGIKNAYQLKNCDDHWIRKKMSIVGLKTVMELRGKVCFSLQDDIPSPNKSLIVSRSFGKRVTELSELKEAVATYMSRAAEKLRAQQSVACSITAFVAFAQHHDYHRIYKSASIELPLATAYTPDLIAAAHSCLEKLYQKGIGYKKAGVMLCDFYDADTIQSSTYVPTPALFKQAQVMHTIDTVNHEWGRNMVFLAAMGTQRAWQAKTAKKSPAYTTKWSDILTIQI